MDIVYKSAVEIGCIIKTRKSYVNIFEEDALRKGTVLNVSASWQEVQILIRACVVSIDENPFYYTGDITITQVQEILKHLAIEGGLKIPQII